MKYSNPKISVIVPVYNVAPYLARCLDSLVGQTMSDIEIICIDDKSTDNSLEILREYERKDKRIHVIALDKNSGVATARNAGIEAARGEYLGFVDSDDYIDADFYEKLYAAAQKENADIARGNVKITKYDGTNIIDHHEIHNIQKYGKWYFSWQWWCAIYRAEMVTQNDIRFPAEISNGEDTVFLYTCIGYSNLIAIVPGTYYHYIRREGSLDAKILPPYKIASRIKANFLFANIFNTTNISKSDYICKYSSIISHMAGSFNANTSNKCKDEICVATIELFKRCKYKAELVKNITNSEGKHFADCLQSYDAAGIFKYWKQISQAKQQTVLHIKRQIYLFGFIPIIRLIRTETQLTLRVFGLQLLRKKMEYGVYRLYFLHIPIIKAKRK